MAADAKEFTALSGETSVYIKQIPKSDYDDAVKANQHMDWFLEVRTPAGEDDIQIGYISAGFDSLLAVIAAYLFLALLLGFGIMVLFRIWQGKISLEHLIAEQDGKASLSRFQALIFTFVFMIGFLLILVESKNFPAEVPPTVLAILGGSLGTYLVSKGIQGAVTGGDDAQMKAGSGPMLRFSAPAAPAAQLAIPSGNIGAGAGAYEVAIPARGKGSNPFTPIAVAVEAVKLTVSFDEPQEGLKKSLIRYTDATGNQKTEALTDGQQITTPAARITEVAVQFQSVADFAAVNVKVAPS
jgi:hypothetical protein